jgi:alkylation response protein AidB-like acyl-CoA dehydrogenase
VDFDLSEEQRLLKDSVDGLLADTYDFEARKKHGAAKKGWSDEVWSKFAEQGLLGLPFAEADGGFGAGAIETGIVMEALGRALVLEPYFATVVLGGGFLRLGGSPEQRKAHLPDVVAGKKTIAFAQLEKDSRYDLGDVITSAKKKGAGWVISRAYQGRPARSRWGRRVPRARQRQRRSHKRLSDPGRLARRRHHLRERRSRR